MYTKAQTNTLTNSTNLHHETIRIIYMYATIRA